MEINQLLTRTLEKNASDLHLSVGLPPMFRIDGELERPSDPAITQADMDVVLKAIMSTKEYEDYLEKWEADFAYIIEGVGRFRVNVFGHDRGTGAAFRAIPSKVSTLEELEAPPIFHKLAALPRGLILVTGPTGSGKSTTLAAMVDQKNRTENSHILTIEDPIEFLHTSKHCLINQREVHRDTHSFANALRSALREDPDAILVGELRDLETIRLALTAAETGHLVLGTLHTSSAPKTIDRIIDVFPGNEKDGVRSMLSESLQAVITQTLAKRIGGGRVAAHEIMLGTPAIKNLIREGKTAQMYSAIQTGRASGMQTLEQSLQTLVQQGVVAKKDAELKSKERFS